MSARLDRITDQAALWLVRAQAADFSGADREEFASWLAASAEHVLEYLSVAAVSQDIRRTSQGLDVDALVLLARQAADEHNVVALYPPDAPAASGTRKSGNRVPRSVLGATAASLLAVILFGSWQWWSDRAVVHTTAVGEQASFPLPDGSLMILNARSTVEVAYTPRERTVRLKAGEALFVVEKDPDRSFQVITGQAMIEALGTSFNVRNRGERTVITVVQGVVDVRSLNELSVRRLSDRGAAGRAVTTELQQEATSARLTAGQQVSVDSENTRVTVLHADVDKITSWRERRLVFEDEPLSEIISEFNYYSDRPILIEGPDLGATLISGSFDADDPDSFALFLSGAGIAVAGHNAGGDIVLRPAY